MLEKINLTIMRYQNPLSNVEFSLSKKDGSLNVFLYNKRFVLDLHLFGFFRNPKTRNSIMSPKNIF